MYRLSLNLGASTSWNPQGLLRPVIGLLFLSQYFLVLNRTPYQLLIDFSKSKLIPSYFSVLLDSRFTNPSRLVAQTTKCCTDVANIFSLIITVLFPVITLTARSIDRAVSVRVFQPQPAPLDYPTCNTPLQSRVPTTVLCSLCSLWWVQISPETCRASIV
jgi:hypothetical protein